MTCKRTLPRHAIAALALTALAVTATRAGAPSTPVILGVAPSPAERADAPQLITVAGRDFQAGLTLEVRAPDAGTTVVKGSEIRAWTSTSFQATLRLAATGDHLLTVTNPDGGVSEPFPLTVAAPGASMAPVIERVRPAEVVHGPQAQDLVVEGQRFPSDLRALVTDPIGTEVTDVTVSQVEASSFRLRVRLDTAGDYELSVSTAAGEVSNVVRIVVR